MAELDSPELKGLLARIVEILQTLFQLRSSEDEYSENLNSVIQQLEIATEQSGNLDLLRLLWPQVHSALSRFLSSSAASGLGADILRRAVDALAGRIVSYFATPPTTDADLKQALAQAIQSADEIVAHGSESPLPYEGSNAVAADSEGPKQIVTFAERRPGAARLPRKVPVNNARIVNSGLSADDRPEIAIDPKQSLKEDTSYWFWMGIGKLDPRSIEEYPTPLPNAVPADALLTVALFSFPDELILIDKADVGTLRLVGTRGSRVVEQTSVFKRRFPKSRFRLTRLFFPVRTPAKKGIFRLRANLYYQHVLLQSRIVTTAVGPYEGKDRALRSVVDFKISHTLEPSRLGRMGSQTLSLFVNQNSEGTHGFYFEGEKGFKTQTTIDGQMLQDSLDQVRRALRRVAWGLPDPWQPSFAYRYGVPGSSSNLVPDLIALAVRGFMLYAALIKKIAGGAEASKDLASIMLRPGRVQISSKESARMVIPAALFYDRRLDTQAPSLTVCDAFLHALQAKSPLESSPCLLGDCPHLGELTVVCPSGFWGYRHEIGLPVSIEEASIGDAETDIQFNDPAALVMIVCNDKMFTQLGPHEQEMKRVRSPLDLTFCDARSKALKALAGQGSEVIYFYCHGGITADNTPFLLIGNNEALTPDNLSAYNIRWKAPRPLVFLNGCMTAALEPERAIEFVSAFVSQAAASGVIGTEITVFEPLATRFSETFFKNFLGACQSVGASIRLARLALLQESNPLGLVYIPFALPGLRLVDLKSQVTTGS